MYRISTFDDSPMMNAVVLILKLSIGDDAIPTTLTKNYSVREFTPNHAKKSKRGKFKRSGKA